MLRTPPLASFAGPLLLACLVAAPARSDFIDHFANPEDVGALKVPRSGSPRVLVVPVVVDDLPFEGGSESAWLDEVNAFFDPDAEGWALRPYYSTASLGRFSPRPEVADVVRFPTCPSIGGYQDCEIPRGAGFADGNIPAALTVLHDALFFIDQVLTCADQGPGEDRSCSAGGGVDFARFDNAGADGDSPDGFVDGVIFVSNAGFPGIALPVKDLTEADLLSFLGPFPSFSYDGVTVGAVAIAGRESPPRRATYVTVHEFGHLLGWVDLYTESGNSTDMPYTVMGGWFYAQAGSLPDGFSRAAAGFAHVIQASGKRSYTLGPAADTGTVLKVGTGDEYFMVELRNQRDDVDGDMAVDSGVVVERVRLQKRPSPDRGSYPSSLTNYVNDDPDDSFLGIEQADGLFDLERGRARKDSDDLFQAGDSIAPSDDTTPRSPTHRVFSTNRFDGTRTDITIRVTEVSDGSATIEVDAPEVDDACKEIKDLCGDQPCEDGACGAVEKSATPPAEGCGCGAVDPAPLALLLLTLLAHRRRRSLRLLEEQLEHPATLAV